MTPIVAVVLVLFAPSRFVEVAVRHDLDTEFTTNTEWRASYPDRQAPPEQVEKFRTFAWERTNKLRKAVFRGIGVTSAAIIAGLVAGLVLRRLFGPAPLVATAGLQIAGGGIILGATLAEVGREISSWTQNSLAEHVNRWVFHSLYVFGTFVFVMSIGWSRS